MPSIQLYSSENIDDLVWPDSHTGVFGRKYLLPLIKEGVESFVANIETDLYILRADDEIIPLTVNAAEWENSYVCSPYTHYISYVLEELPKLKSKTTARLLACFVKGVGKVLRQTKINKVVIVNNWLFSTNIYPRLSEPQLEAVHRLLLAHFPGHALLFKSVDTYRESLLLQTLKQMGGLAIGSRKVYFWDPNRPEAKSQYARKHIRKDTNVKKASPYRLAQLDQNNVSEATRLSELYKYLYLDKYSYYNPQYTPRFFETVLEQSSLRVYALRERDSEQETAKDIDGIVACYVLSGVLVTPVLGYDTQIEQKTGLYRMLVLQALEMASQEGLIFHVSSGVGEYKMNRGCIGAMEYTVVFSAHLGVSRRVAWSALARIVNAIGIPLLTKYEL